MTVEEVHEHNKRIAISHLSYEAVCTDDFVIKMREWISKELSRAYEAGFKAAKEGKL